MSANKNYAWDAKDYAKNSQNQYQWAQELIPKLKLQGNEHILDIGCGDGKITAQLTQFVPRGCIVGIDSSAQMINLAQTNFSETQNPNLSFRLMDARSLSFCSEFDLAFSNAALHWIVDQKAVLSGVKQSLKSGGRLLFQMAGKGNAKAILDILDKLRTEEPWQSYFEGFRFPYAFLGVEEYRGLLVEAGLEPLRVELFPRDMKFPSAEGMAGWVRTTWLPFTERVPPEKREEFVKEIVACYLKEHTLGSEGVVHLGMMRLEVEAEAVAV
jgi:trans-aconitate methyltransferase